MLREDIEHIAFYKMDMPLGAGVKDLIYYHCIESLYRMHEGRKIKKSEASKKKQKIADYLDTLEGIAHSNAKIIVELSKLTAPRADMVKKDKAELLEVVNRIEGLVTGLIKEYDQAIPKFLSLGE